MSRLRPPLNLHRSGKHVRGICKILGFSSRKSTVKGSVARERGGAEKRL